MSPWLVFLLSFTYNSGLGAYGLRAADNPGTLWRRSCALRWSLAALGVVQMAAFLKLSLGGLQGVPTSVHPVLGVPLSAFLALSFVPCVVALVHVVYEVLRRLMLSFGRVPAIRPLGWGEAAAAQGDPLRAIHLYNVELLRDPEDRVARLGLARILHLCRQDEEALRHYRAALGRLPVGEERAQVCLEMARLYSDQGDLEGARRMLAMVRVESAGTEWGRRAGEWMARLDVKRKDRRRSGRWTGSEPDGGRGARDGA